MTTNEATPQRLPGATAALLVLCDGRLPSGGHAHSGGVEAAVARGLVGDVDSLAGFLAGRLATAGLVAAGLAAAACAGVDPAGLDVEADARLPVPALRATSRAQGRALLRVAGTAWPAASYAAAGPRPHHAVALGVVARAAGCSPREAALAAAYAAVSGPAWAAVRLLGLDPMEVQRVVADLSDELDAVAGAAAEAATTGALPAAAGPVSDLLAARHARARRDGQVTLFAS